MTDDLTHADPAREAMVRDDPELDCTDFAHPAWWRGEAYGCQEVIRAISKVLDGETVTEAHAAPLGSVRQRIATLTAAHDTLRAENARLRELVERAQKHLPDHFVNWHESARVALAGETA